MVPRLLAVSISDSQKAVHSDHEGASIPELGEAPSFRIAGEERLLQEIVGQALVPSANHLVARTGAHMIIISPRCHARSATTPWMLSRPPPGNSQSPNDIVDAGPEKCQICPTLLVKRQYVRMY